MIKQIADQIYTDVGLRTVHANTTNPRPPLPYAVYNVTAPYIKEVGQPSITYKGDGDDLQQKREEQYLMTISFTLYANDDETTVDYAKKVRSWFLFYGQDYIQNQNIAVVSVGNIENRTTFLVDSYEFKYGFDVQLRLSDEQARNINYFDKVGE